MQHKIPVPLKSDGSYKKKSERKSFKGCWRVCVRVCVFACVPVRLYPEK